MVVKKVKSVYLKKSNNVKSVLRLTRRTLVSSHATSIVSHFTYSSTIGRAIISSYSCLSPNGRLKHDSRHLNDVFHDCFMRILVKLSKKVSTANIAVNTINCLRLELPNRKQKSKLQQIRKLNSVQVNQKPA